MKLPARYKSTIDIISRYLSAYGGLSEIAKSPYAHLGLLLTILTLPTATSENWDDTVLSIVPSLLGFTVATYAIVLGMTSYKIFDILANLQDGKKQSELMTVMSTFAHFSMMQILALIGALIGNSESAAEVILLSKQYFFGNLVLIPQFVEYFLFSIKMVFYFIFCYAICLSIAAVLALFRLTSWVNDEKQD